MNHQRLGMMVMSLLMIFLIGCGSGNSSATITETSAATVIAEEPTPTSTPILPTNTPLPLTSTPTLLPTVTVTHTPTPIPTDTPTPTPSSTPTSTATPTIAAQKIIGMGNINDIAWSPNGQLLAAASVTGLSLYDVETLSEFASEELGLLFSATWSSDGSEVLASGFGLFSWGERGLEQLGTGIFWDVAHSSNDNLTALSEGPSVAGSLNYIVVPGGTLPLLLSEPTDESSDLSLAGQSESRTVSVWNLENKTQLAVLNGHEAGMEIRTVAFSPDGEMLATAGDDNTIIIWHVATGTQQTILSNYTGFTEPVTVMYVAWSPDGKRLASGGSGLVIWDVENGTTIHEFSDHTAYVTSVAWSPDGMLLASASQDQTIKVWDTTSGVLLHTLQGHSNQVWGVDWSPDGTHIASAGWDKTIRIWDVSFLVINE